MKTLEELMQEHPEQIRVNGLTAAEYEKEIREKVEKSMTDPHPSIPHEEVMAEMDKRIAEARAKKEKAE